MTTATTQHTWHGLTIPSCLAPDGKVSPNRIELRLASEQVRRQWELHCYAILTVKRMQGFLYIEPRRYGDDRRPDLSGVWTAVEALPKGPGQIFGTELSAHFQGFTHESGLQVFGEMLDVVARQFESIALEPVQ